MNGEELINSPKEFNNVIDLYKDLVAGDESTIKRLEALNLDVNAIRTAVQVLADSNRITEQERNQLMLDSWRIVYRDRPPTPEEFLTEKYIGPTAKTIYPHIKKVFLEFMDPTVNYRKLILSGFIGFGKSFCSTLITLYITVCVSLMRDPWKFFGLSPSSLLTQFLCSYSLKKSSELLLEPFNAILESSPFFEKIHARDKMVQANEEYKRMEHIDKIFYTTAAPTSELSFAGGCNIKLTSNPNGLLGCSIVSIVLSELSFFSDAGKALDLNTPILLKDRSTKLMKDIAVGDKLFPINGEENVVEKIMWEGEDDLYEIEFDDGRTVRCNLKHLWKVKYNNKEEVVTTQFLLDHPEIEFEIPEIN